MTSPPRKTGSGGRLKLDLDRVESQQSLNRILSIIQPYAQGYGLGERVASAAEKLNEMEFKIAVVANMSSGKSTFINALFGDFLLPAFHEATTDCATHIYPDPGNGEMYAQIHFEDERPCVTIPENLVREEIKKYAVKDDLLSDPRYKAVRRIDLHWRFDRLRNTEGMNFKFTLIDTPGPNNTGGFQEKHKAIANKIIRETADLVLFLFDYGQLDANLYSDEQGLWEIIKSRGKSDTFFDVFFIINKIDMALDDDGKKGRERGFSKAVAMEKLRSHGHPPGV